MPDIRILTEGDSSVLVEFGKEISPEINRKITAIVQLMKEQHIEGVVDMIPAFCSLLVNYDPRVISYDDLKKRLEILLKMEVTAGEGCRKVYEIPVCYGGEYGPDIENIAEHAGLSVEEVIKIKEIVSEVKEELTAQGIPFKDDVETGIMIETPAAALISDDLAKKVDFFSVGTNDLTQYTLAIDRQNRMLEPFCNTHHKAVLKLIRMAADNAHKEGKWIGICGELGADITLTEEFLKMGIDELSVSANMVLKVRDKVRSINLKG